MTGRKLVCVVFVVAFVAVAGQAAVADEVTSDTSKGKCYLTVAAGIAPVYGVHLFLQRGSFHSWMPPDGWTFVQPGPSELVFLTATSPIAVGSVQDAFMVKASGRGANTVWETLGADGAVIDWGRVDLK